MTDEDDGVPESGRLDRTTMETLARRSETHPLVTSWAFRPDQLSPRVLEITLDSSAYPPSVDAVRLDIHWFVSGDYYIHYLETHEEIRYQCRWDRHPKTDAPRTHFHRLNKADTSGLDPEEEADTPRHNPRLIANPTPHLGI